MEQRIMTDPEMSLSFLNDETQRYVIHVTKQGGGTVGNRYDGVWFVDVISPEWFETDIDYHCGMHKTHFEIAMECYDWFREKHEHED